MSAPQILHAAPRQALGWIALRSVDAAKESVTELAWLARTPGLDTLVLMELQRVIGHFEGVALDRPLGVALLTWETTLEPPLVARVPYTDKAALEASLAKRFKVEKVPEGFALRGGTRTVFGRWDEKGEALLLALSPPFLVPVPSPDHLFAGADPPDLTAWVDLLGFRKATEDGALLERSIAALRASTQMDLHSATGRALGRVAVDGLADLLLQLREDAVAGKVAVWLSRTEASAEVEVQTRLGSPSHDFAGAQIGGHPGGVERLRAAPVGGATSMRLLWSVRTPAPMEARIARLAGLTLEAGVNELLAVSTSTERQALRRAEPTLRRLLSRWWARGSLTGALSLSGPLERTEITSIFAVDRAAQVQARLLDIFERLDPAGEPRTERAARPGPKTLHRRRAASPEAPPLWLGAGARLIGLHVGRSTQSLRALLATRPAATKASRATLARVELHFAAAARAGYLQPRGGPDYSEVTAPIALELQASTGALMLRLELPGGLFAALMEFLRQRIPSEAPSWL